jgi:hypothetical protein
MFPLTALANKVLIGATATVVLALGSATGVLYVKNTNLKTELAQAKLDMKTAQSDSDTRVAMLTANYRKTEGQLVARIQEDKEKADETISDLTARAATLSASLRRAQAARDALAAVPSAPTDSSPDQVAGDGNRPLVPAEIGESDVAEALRADTIRVELLRCYAAYDRAEQAMLLFTNQPLESNPMSQKSPVDHLISLGAESVGGDLMYQSKVLGSNRNGVFVLTEAGEKMMGVEDAVVVVKTAAPADVAPAQAAAAKPAAKKAAKDKSRDAGNVQAAEAAPEVAPVDTTVVAAAQASPDMATLDSLLGE